MSATKKTPQTAQKTTLFSFFKKTDSPLGTPPVDAQVLPSPPVSGAKALLAISTDVGSPRTSPVDKSSSAPPSATQIQPPTEAGAYSARLSSIAAIPSPLGVSRIPPAKIPDVGTPGPADEEDEGPISTVKRKRGEAASQPRAKPKPPPEDSESSSASDGGEEGDESDDDEDDDLVPEDEDSNPRPKKRRSPAAAAPARGKGKASPAAKPVAIAAPVEDGGAEGVEDGE